MSVRSKEKKKTVQLFNRLKIIATVYNMYLYLE